MHDLDKFARMPASGSTAGQPSLDDQLRCREGDNAAEVS